MPTPTTSSSSLSQNSIDARLAATAARFSRDLNYQVSFNPPANIGARKCAVLIPLYKISEKEIGVRLTLRSDLLTSFPNTLVFPGGKVERYESYKQAAVREYQEEVGGVVKTQDLIASLPVLYKTYNNQQLSYQLLPTFGLISTETPININEDEVKAVIDVPLNPESELCREVHGRLSGLTKFLFDIAIESRTFLAKVINECEQNQIVAEKPLRVIVTSGGTRVPIDRVRVLTNQSAGTTGAMIAETLLEQGNQVYYLCSKDTKVPYQKDTSLDIHSINSGKDLEEELERVKKNSQDLFHLTKQSTIERVPTFNDYRTRLLDLCADSKNDAVIMVMAASDFGPKMEDGKISSNKSHLSIECEPLPKVISEVKAARGNISLVGFKLLIDEAPDLLIEKAYRNMLRDKQDLAIANVGRGSMRPDQMLSYIVTGERGVIPVERSILPQVLSDMISKRFSRRYFKTNVSKVNQLPVESKELQKFISYIKELSKLAIFNPYHEDRREEFGFVAKRTDQGTLITSRASSKAMASLEDLTLVTNVEFENLTLDVTTVNKKASLNASVAHMIFENRPEINYIVHAHISLPDDVEVIRDTSPSTAEDWEYLEPFVKDGDKVIGQAHHGVIILLENQEDLYPILERNSIYLSNPKHYDHAYSRFLKSERLVDLLKEEISVDDAVLDVAAGTGEVSKLMIAKGFSDITVTDASQAMLQVAQDKLSRILSADRFLQSSIQDLSFSKEFSGAILRQAVNYLPPEELVAGLKQIGSCLKSGGKLLFNTFNPKDLQEHQNRYDRREVDGKVIVTSEGNLFTDKKVYHGQRSEIFDVSTGEYDLVYDLNSFWIYSSEEFTNALREAGAKDIKVITENRSLYFISTW